MRSPRVDRWRQKELREEAWRRAGAFSALAGLIVAVAVAAVGLMSFSQLRDAVRQEQRQASAGINVLVVSVPEGRHLSARSCESLGSQAPTLGAGAYFGENVSVDARSRTTGSAIPMTDLTLGALRVWWPTAPAEGGLFVGRDLRATSGIAAGTVVSVGGQDVAVRDALPPGVVPDVLQSSLVRVVPATGELATECWIHQDRSAAGSAEAMAQAAFAGTPVTVVPFVRADDLTTDPAATLAAGSGPWVWLAGLAACLVVFIVRALTTRAEFGIYRVTGTRLSEIACMSLVQGALILLPASLFGITAVTLALVVDGTVGTEPQALWFVLQPSVLVALGALGLSPLVDVSVASRSIVDMMRS